MARPGDGGDQPNLGPNQPYPSAGQPQFPPPQYPYHTTSEYPSLDQELNMSDTFGATPQQNIASQLQEAANAPRNGDVNTMSVNTNGTASAGMAPPQTPHQTGFSPTGGRASVDETPDPAEATGSKRKRSKVSRACDECRRKKVKCDAADLEGALKTCTNCQKAGLTCEYSRIPMKRGPSKGYIKELSDRVQQVESLQAVLAGQPGYRQSLDGSTMGDTLYSPDDPMTLKRNFSFSDARNPFAASEFQRDRIPSAGAACANSPTSAGFRARDRGSLAIAPDQALPPTSYPKSSTPYWVTSPNEPPPNKRQKRDTSHILAVKMESKYLTKYYEVIHPEFPLLPDLDATLSIAKSASSKVQLFFAAAVELIPATDGDDTVKQAILHAFPDCKSLSQFFSDESIINPAMRSAEESLLFTWACIILSVHCEYKLKGALSVPTWRTKLIKQAIDMTTFLLRYDSASSDSTEGRTPTAIDPETFNRLATRARNLTLLLAKFHAVATASVEFVLPEYYSIDLPDIQAMPHDVGFVAGLANLMSQAILVVQSMQQAHNPLSPNQKDVIMSQIQGYVNVIPGMTRDAPIVKQASLFFELVLSRCTYIPTTAAVLAPAAQLAEELALGADPVGTGKEVWKVLDAHMFTLTVITLLEVLAAVADAGLLAIAEQALNTVQGVVERKVEIWRNGRSALERGEKWDIEEGGEEEEEEAVVKGEEGGRSWMEVLLRHIIERRKVGWAQGGNANGGGPSVVNAINAVGPAFDVLLRTGYLRVLGNLV